MSVRRFWLPAALSILISSFNLHADPGITYDGKEGPGKGKHVLLMAGDWEYRSEESLPMLGKILAAHHGFRCTVLFPMNPQDGTIDPGVNNNVPGLEKLATADLLIIFAMHLKLPDEQMRHIVDYVNAGKPVIGIRGSIVGFPAKQDMDGGFAEGVLGGSFAAHHGLHGKESTRALINGLQSNHAILKGVTDIWGPTDVYRVKNFAADNTVLMWGQVLRGMAPNDPPNFDKPIIPLIWIRHFKTASGKTARALTTTIGCSVDFESEGLRRLLVNGAYWCLGMENNIQEESKVDYIDAFEPSPFGRGRFVKGRKPADHAMEALP